jgi:hypothetical protein
VSSMVVVVVADERTCVALSPSSLGMGEVGGMGLLAAGGA